MRSPMIAFSLFAAVSPTLIAAAPQSPNLANDVVPQMRTDAKFPQHLAVPRQLNSLTSALSPHSNSDEVSGEPLPGDTETDVSQASTPKGTKDMKDMKAVLASKLPPKSAMATDSTSNAVADPAMALNHPAEPEEPKAPSFVATPPAPAASSAVGGDSKVLSKDVEHDDAVTGLPNEDMSSV
ncbi:hypothetical protein C8Q73DRAFT_685301 [Cubamyces lactineus]|nr:hypothetical protein C8Q73DRAFT_685301 [Cubamyces lactineus]